MANWMPGRLAKEDFRIIPKSRGFVKVGTEKPDPEDARLEEKAWKFGANQIQHGACHLIVLNEVNFVIKEAGDQACLSTGHSTQRGIEY